QARPGLGHPPAYRGLRGSGLHGPAGGGPPPERRREGQSRIPALAEALLQLAAARGIEMTDKPPGAKFPLGRLVATPGAIEALAESGQTPAFFIDRHLRGDWGDVDAEDWQANDRALQDGSRLLSAYRTLKGKKLWVITEAAGDDGKRAATTILLPDEY